MALVRIAARKEFAIDPGAQVPPLLRSGWAAEQLVLPRRTDPRVRVPRGSIAIAAGMTAVYPVESPGGWHLIGATPLTLFDPTWSQPALIAAGDEVLFEPIEAAAFEQIRAAVAEGSYRARSETVAP